MNHYFNLFILFLFRVNLFCHCNKVKENIIGSKISFELRDKIYETIRTVESDIFYERKDNSKIMKLIEEIIEIIKNNKRNELNVYNNNSCKGDARDSCRIYGNFLNYNFSLFKVENIVKFIAELEVYSHDLFEGIFKGLYEENFCYLNKIKLNLKENIIQIVESFLSGKNFVSHLKNIYDKIRDMEDADDHCKLKNLIKKILRVDEAFGSILSAYRILNRDDDILKHLSEVYESVDTGDYKRLGYASGKLVSVMFDINK